MYLPDRVAFNIFGLSIYWYGIIVAAAIFTAIFYCIRKSKAYDLHPDTVVDFAIVIIPAAIIGARLYYVLFTLENYLSNPLEIFMIRDGGLAVYGGIIGSVIATAIMCRFKKIPLIKMCDLAAPALALGQAIGRWGNFVNQEAYGPVVTNTSMQFFPISVWIPASNNWHMATFFYESMACLAIFLFLRWWGKRAPRAGTITLLYGLCYGVVRAVLEGLRQDSLYIFGNVRASQVLSIALVILCGIVLVRRWRADHEITEVNPDLVMRRREDDQAEAEASDEAEETEEAAEGKKDNDQEEEA